MAAGYVVVTAAEVVVDAVTVGIVAAADEVVDVVLAVQG